MINWEGKHTTSLDNVQALRWKGPELLTWLRKKRHLFYDRYAARSYSTKQV